MNSENNQVIGELEQSIYSLVGNLNQLVVKEQLNLQEELARVGTIIADAADALTHNFKVMFTNKTFNLFRFQSIHIVIEIVKLFF